MKTINFILIIFFIYSCSSVPKKHLQFHFPTYQITTADSKSGFISLSANVTKSSALSEITENKTKIGNIIISTIKTCKSDMLQPKKKKSIELTLAKKINMLLRNKFVSKITINEISIN